MLGPVQQCKIIWLVHIIISMDQMQYCSWHNQARARSRCVKAFSLTCPKTRHSYNRLTKFSEHRFPEFSMHPSLALAHVFLRESVIPSHEWENHNKRFELLLKYLHVPRLLSYQLWLSRARSPARASWKLLTIFLPFPRKKSTNVCALTYTSVDILSERGKSVESL